MCFNLYIYYYAEKLRCLISDEKSRSKIELIKKWCNDFNFILHWLEVNARGFVVLLNPHKLFESDFRTIQLLKNTIMRLPELKNKERFFLKFFIISSISRVPDEIQRETFYIDIPLSTKKEIQYIMD